MTAHIMAVMASLARGGAGTAPNGSHIYTGPNHIGTGKGPMLQGLTSLQHGILSRPEMFGSHTHCANTCATPTGGAMLQRYRLRGVGHSCRWQLAARRGLLQTISIRKSLSAAPPVTYGMARAHRPGPGRKCYSCISCPGSRTMRKP